MWTVISINKEGNRLVSYTCAINDTVTILSKSDLIKLIKQGKVRNAKVQRYKGSEIVRVKEIPGELGRTVDRVLAKAKSMNNKVNENKK